MGSRFDIDAYPTRCFYAAFHGRTVYEAALLPVLVISAIGVLFLAYDWGTQGRIRRLAERAALERAEAAQQKARHIFVASVSHEVRTPAAAIAGAVEVLQSDEPTESQRDLLALISQGVHQILQMARNKQIDYNSRPTPLQQTQPRPGVTAEPPVPTTGKQAAPPYAICSQVEDALNMDSDGYAPGTFKLCPQLADPVRDVLDRAVNTVRLDSRISGKLTARAVLLTVEVAGAAPPLVYVDAGRFCQIVSNLVRDASAPFSASRRLPRT